MLIGHYVLKLLFLQTFKGIETKLKANCSNVVLLVNILSKIVVICLIFVLDQALFGVL